MNGSKKYLALLFKPDGSENPFWFPGFIRSGTSNGQKDCSKQQDCIGPEAPELFYWK